MSKDMLILNKKPIILKRKSTFINQSLFRDTIIYDSKETNYFKDKYERVTLFNRQNVLTHSCKLIAKIGTLDGEILEKTSDGIVKMIGQDQFEVLFMALCSIINQEIRIRGLISILTTNEVEKSDQKDVRTNSKPEKVDVWSQTDETRLAKVNVNRKRRMRRQLAPYVVQDFKVPGKIKKVIVDISEHTQTTSKSNEMKETLTDLGSLPDLHDDNSNDTNISQALSVETTHELMTNPYAMLLQNVEDCIKDTDKEVHEKDIIINENPDHFDNQTRTSNNDETTSLEMIQQNTFNLILPDNTSIMLPAKPEDHFHIATEENLKFVDSNSRKKLIEVQRVIDLKFCLSPVDDEGNLPIHMAVLNEDLHLLKRQCFILSLKETSVDIEANGLTPLNLSLFNQSVSATLLLLSFGADPLLLNESHSTYFHTAAELNTEHLSALLQYCKNNARMLISENEDLQKPGWEQKSDDELSSFLMDHICSICDSQGYTPLMLATNLGLYSNVRALLSHSPTSVHIVNPTTGNTPLYLAVVAACNVAAERGNKSKLVDNFRQTIEILLDYGADPTIDNYSGSNISVLLTDFQCPELYTLIANRGPASKFKNTADNYNSLMFIKNDDETKVKNSINDNKNTTQLKGLNKMKEKPVILESIVLKSQTDSKVIKIESDLVDDHADSVNDHADSNKINSDIIKIESDSPKYDTDSIKDADSNSTTCNGIKIEYDSIKSLSDSTGSQADSTNNHAVSKTFEIKIVKDSIKILDNSNLSQLDLTKSISKRIKIDFNPNIITNANSTKTQSKTKSEILSKLIESKNRSPLTNEKSMKSKISSNNIIVNKPDKIILTPVKLIEVDRSTDSIKSFNSSIERIDLSINPLKKVDAAVLMKSLSNISRNKAKDIKNLRSKSGPIPNKTFADFDPETDSNMLPSDIHFLYNPTNHSNRSQSHLKSSTPIVISVQNGNESIARPIDRAISPVSESLTVTKAQPKVYTKKSTANTKKSVKNKIDSDNCEVPSKTFKINVSDSE